MFKKWDFWVIFRLDEIEVVSFGSKKYYSKLLIMWNY